MVSWTHLVEKTLDSNGLMYHPTGLDRGKMQMAIHSLTDPFYTANFYPSYLLIGLHKNRLTSTLERKKRRLVVMTMTRSILKIISFVVHFINDIV
jgi:hypothetical protein